MEFNFDHLDSTDFEEFCFDLLSSLGFLNLSWRKGTGLSSSPADQGRDIEGEVLRSDLDAQKYFEKWFIECKHHKKGVPPTKLQDALSWASAKRPDVVLFILSGYLSNAAKQFIKEYKESNKPSFRIRVWERKKIENLTAGMAEIVRKYRLASELPFLKVVNKYHLIYATKPFLNTVGHFIELMDQLDKDKRDEAFSWAYFDLVNPRFRQPVSGNESLANLQKDEADYDEFRKICLNVNRNESPNFVHKLVTSGLAWIFHFADTTEVGTVVRRNQALVDALTRELDEEEDEERKRVLRSMFDLPRRTIADYPRRAKDKFELYTYVCENLVRKLIAEAEAPNDG